MDLYLITEGEIYYNAWLPHIIYGDEAQAFEYRKDLIRRSQVVRWPNVYIWHFELGKAGGRLLTPVTEIQNAEFDGCYPVL